MASKLVVKALFYYKNVFFLTESKITNISKQHTTRYVEGICGVITSTVNTFSLNFKNKLYPRILFKLHGRMQKSPPLTKRSALNSIVHRAVSISEAGKFESELPHLRNSLANNSYKNRDIQFAFNRHLPESPNYILAALFPYFLSVTDIIGKILKKRLIRTIF